MTVAIDLPASRRKLAKTVNRVEKNSFTFSIFHRKIQKPFSPQKIGVVRSLVRILKISNTSLFCRNLYQIG